jgi:hypothetical protein
MALRSPAARCSAVSRSIPKVRTAPVSALASRKKQAFVGIQVAQILLE